MGLSAPLRIIVGADGAGYDLKEAVKAFLAGDDRVKEVVDIGVDGTDDTTAYPSVGFEAGRRIAAGDADRALLVCGTGIGVAIAANKVEGIRATVAHDPFSVERSVLSNNAQVLTFGGRIIAPQLAVKLADEWLRHEFDPTSASAAKVQDITDFETDG
jgi:ribose 5-phosphate isomerase B